MSCKLSHWTRELVILRACSTGRTCRMLRTSFGLVNAAIRIFPFWAGRLCGSPGWAAKPFGWLLFWAPFMLLLLGPFPFDIGFRFTALPLLLMLPLLPFSALPAPRLPFLCLRYFTCWQINGKNCCKKLAHSFIVATNIHSNIRLHYVHAKFLFRSKLVVRHMGKHFMDTPYEQNSIRWTYWPSFKLDSYKQGYFQEVSSHSWKPKSRVQMSCLPCHAPQ